MGGVIAEYQGAVDSCGYVWENLRVLSLVSVYRVKRIIWTVHKSTEQDVFFEAAYSPVTATGWRD